MGPGLPSWVSAPKGRDFLRTGLAHTHLFQAPKSGMKDPTLVPRLYPFTPSPRRVELCAETGFTASALRKPPKAQLPWAERCWALVGPQGLGQC